MNSIVDTSPGPSRESNGSWRMAALTALATVLLAVVGWIATDATTARAKMAEDISASSQRIAVLEEANRNVRESQSRIEKVLDEIRVQLQQQEVRGRR